MRSTEHAPTLAQTVDALHDKLDVKARAKTKAHEVSATQIAVGAGAVLVVMLVLKRIRQSR